LGRESRSAVAAVNRGAVFTEGGERNRGTGEIEEMVEEEEEGRNAPPPPSKAC
jgi:hypothetical protein